MPEGPELHLASLYVNTTCAGLCFGGAVEKSAVSKNPEVPFSSRDYTVSAVSRGKEVKLILTPASGDTVDIIFRFGMSGSFKLCPEDEMPKHAHLRFYTKELPRRVLSFVDPRRFGSWEMNGDWQSDRGPCVMLEYDKFRENVLSHLTDKAFDKPICEVMLNQKYFNGIGNYLRAEILHRLQIPPFVQARPILEALKHPHQDSDVSLSKKIKIKEENPDLLQLCNLVPLEVIKLGGKGYDPEQSNDYSVFMKWLRCYFVPGMNSLRDHNGRTIWFQGDPGPLAPKGQKAKKRSPSIGTKRKHVKVEKTEVKRSGKKILLKKEDTEIKHEENAVKVTVKRRVKRTGDKMENGKRGRKISNRSTALDTDSLVQKGGKNTPAVKTRPQRRKSSTTPISIDSPKPKRRALRKTTGRQRTTKRKS